MTPLHDDEKEVFVTGEVPHPGWWLVSDMTGSTWLFVDEDMKATHLGFPDKPDDPFLELPEQREGYSAWSWHWPRNAIKPRIDPRSGIVTGEQGDFKLGAHIDDVAVDALPAQAPAAVAVPDGWKLVPIEPQPEQLDSAIATDRDGTPASYKTLYIAMVGAALTPPIFAAQAEVQAESVALAYPHEQMDALAISRYKIVPSDQSMYWRHAVVAGDGQQHLYNGSEVDCQNLARKFAGAFLDGAFAFHSLYTAPQAQPAPVQAESVAWPKGVAQFTKKPVTINAIQWDGKNLHEVISFTQGSPDTRSERAQMAWHDYASIVEREGLQIHTLEGQMLANVGDWIIRGVKGEHYPCKPDIFAATYEPAAAPQAQPTDALDKEAIEELSQLGYTVKDGRLIPPDYVGELMAVVQTSNLRTGEVIHQDAQNIGASDAEMRAVKFGLPTGEPLDNGRIADNTEEVDWVFPRGVLNAEEVKQMDKEGRIPRKRKRKPAVPTEPIETQAELVETQAEPVETAPIDAPTVEFPGL